MLYHIFLYLFSVLSFVAPEISEALTVTDVTQTSVSLSWSIFNTQHIDLIKLHQWHAGQWSTTKNTLSNSSHIVTSLIPGSKYQFYVKIRSYGKTNSTNTITVTTGATSLAGLLFWETVMVPNSKFS